MTRRNRFEAPGPKPWLMLAVALVFLAFAVELADVLSVRGRRPGETGAAAEPPRATASLPPVADIVRWIGGGRWRADALLGPGQDPHVYEPTPRQVAALAASRLFFRTGMPFEEALAARVAAAHPEVKTVVLDSATPRGGRGRTAEAGGRTAGAGGHAHDHDAVHGWLSPANLDAWARRIAAELKAAEPEASGEIALHQAAWLDSLGHEDKATLAAVSNSTVRAFAAWHPAYGAWADFYGLEQIALEEDGKAPGPQTLAAARGRIAASGAETMLVQNEAEAARVAEFARGAGLRVAVVPPLGADPLETMRLLREAVFGASQPAP